MNECTSNDDMIRLSQNQSEVGLNESFKSSGKKLINDATHKNI